MHHHGHHGHMAAHHCGPHGPRVVPMMGMAAMGAAAGAASTRPRTTYTPPRTNVIIVEKEKGHHSPTTTQQQQPSPPPAFSYPYAGAAPYPGGYGPYPGTQQGPYPGGPGPYQGAPGPYQGPPPPNPPPAGTAQNPYPQYSGGGGPYVGPGSPYRGPEAPYPTGEDDGKYSTQHRVSPTSAVASDQPKRATSLGKRWQNGNVIRLHSVTSTKNLRINKKGIVDGNGGSGQWAKFMIQRVSDDRIRLRNTGHGDTYLTLTPHHLSQGPPDVEAEFYVVKHVTKIKGERIYSLESVTYPGCFVGVDENGNVVTPCEVKAGLRGSFVVNVDKWA